MPPTDQYVAEYTFHVRYAETDAMGIVHHGSYIVYFEEGRSNFIRQQGTSYATLEQSGYYLTVTEVNARYLKPVKYDQLITVRCWVAQTRSRSIAFKYEIVDAEGQLCVTGTSKHICINRDGLVTKIPPDWLEWLNN